jgi:hypothetical protein
LQWVGGRQEGPWSGLLPHIHMSPGACSRCAPGQMGGTACLHVPDCAVCNNCVCCTGMPVEC